MSRINDSVHEAAQIIRGLKERVDRLEKEREAEGRVSIVRNIVESFSATDTVQVTVRDETVMVWDESDWELSNWGDET